MKQTTVIGLIHDPSDLNLHDCTRQGLHFARSVVVLSAKNGDALPATGRGKAIAGAESGQVRLNRMIVCWGSDKEVADLIEKSDRPAVFGVALNTGPKAKKAIKKLQDKGLEAHLILMEKKSAVRIIGSDAGKPVIQWSTSDGWQQKIAQSAPAQPVGAQPAPAGEVAQAEPAKAAQSPSTGA